MCVQMETKHAHVKLWNKGRKVGQVGCLSRDRLCLIFPILFSDKYFFSLSLVYATPCVGSTMCIEKRSKSLGKERGGREEALCVCVFSSFLMINLSAKSVVTFHFMVHVLPILNCLLWA